MQGTGFGLGYGMYFGMIFWILIFVGIVALVVWAVQKSAKTEIVAEEETGLDILKKRFASGEIDKDEYEEKKRLIS